MVSAGQFNGNWQAAHDALKSQLGQEPSSGMVAYASNGDTSQMSPDDASRLGIPIPGNVAQKQYQEQANTAIAGLQAQGTSLDQQYQSLLGDVLGQGTVAMNTITTGENNLLGQRGITNNSPLYSREMASAQLPVQVANQSAVGSLGYTEAQLQNALAGNIANLRAGAAGTAAGLPLSYGSLALAQAALPSEIGFNVAQSQNLPASLATQLQIAQLGAAKPFGVGNLVFAPSTGQFKQPGGGGGTPDMASMLKEYLTKKSSKPQMSSIGNFVS